MEMVSCYKIFQLLWYVVIGYGVLWLFLRWKLRIYYERFKNVKTIPGLPLPIGHGYKIIGKNCQGFLKLVNELCHEQCDDKPLKLWIGLFPTIILTNPADISIVMQSRNGLKKHYAYRFIGNNTGLVTAPVEQWRISRKLLNPTFNFKMLQSFIPIFNESSIKLVRNLQKHLNKGEFDCVGEIFINILSIACLTTLGYDLHLQEYENLDLLQVIVEGSGLITQRCFSIWLYPDIFYKLTRGSNRLKKLFGRLHAVTEEIVKCKKAEYAGLSADDKSAIFDEDDIHKPKIFLTQILHMAEKNNLSDLYIRDQVDTMLFAGSETSTQTVSNAILALAMYSNIQERAYQEIAGVPNGAEGLDYEKISQLKYMEMIINETLRLYPVAPFLAREATGDIKISNCTIPEGTQIIVGAYNMHRDTNIWGPDADAFNPDNFLPENINKRHPASFLPFSYGPRNCIAGKYAMMSMKVTLYHVLRNYKFTTHLKAEDLKFTYHLTMKLINGHMVSMTSRHN